MTIEDEEYNVKGILEDVKKREKEERKMLKLINELSINDLKNDKIETTREGIRPVHVTICEMYDNNFQNKGEGFYGS